MGGWPVAAGRRTCTVERPAPLINRQDRILGPGRGHADGGLTGASVDGKSEFLGLDEGGLKKDHD